MSEIKKMPADAVRLLIIDDEETVRDLLKRRFERRGLIVETARSGEEALEMITRFRPEVAISDIRMPGLDGFEVLKAISVPTILITGHGDKESAIRAVEAGAFSFFEKPFDLDAVEIAVKRASEKQRWLVERENLLQRLDRLCLLQEREIENFQRKDFSSFIGESKKIVDIKEMLNLLGRKPHAPLLILGESGTGKEVAALALHQATHATVPAKSGSKSSSSTADNSAEPFVALNCSAIPPDLLESELFGHEKGAFSGAHATRVGLAEVAREGTLFLDEIGDMDPRHQTKLLRLVQERKFRRVGGTQEINFQGRIVAATHRNLKDRIRDGQFREDLFYRLSVVSIELPPLRERGSDILEIAEMLCTKHGARGLTPELIAEVRSYPWPGNIRELNNWIERAVILGQVDKQGMVNTPVPSIQSEEANHLGAASSHGATATNQSDSTRPNLPLHLSKANLPTKGSKANIKELRAAHLEDLDRKLITWALEQHPDNVSAAAKAIGLDRKNFARRLTELGLNTKKRAA